MREYSVLFWPILFVAGLSPADLGGSDELANLENGRGLLHLCSHTSGQYQIVVLIPHTLLSYTSGFICGMFCTGVVLLFAADRVQNEQSSNCKVFKVNFSVYLSEKLSILFITPIDLTSPFQLFDLPHLLHAVHFHFHAHLFNWYTNCLRLKVQ